MTGIPNTMNLRMEYDVLSSTIHATLGSPLNAGETLRMNLRRGRLSDTITTPALDCSKLPVAPPIATSGSGGTSAFIFEVSSSYDQAQVYLGPVVDPSLLATVYPPDWIEQHVSAKGLAELEAEGADSIVEACIMNPAGTYARSKVQTTIANAWDPNDPILGGHSLTSPTPGSSSGSDSNAVMRTAAVPNE